MSDVTIVAKNGGSPGVHPHNDAMRRRIEPGLLRVFRFFVGIRFGLLALMALSLDNRTEEQLLLVPGPGLVVYGILLIYLIAPPVQRLMGRRYLSVGLIVATVSPIVENGIAVGLRLDQGDPPNRAIEDWWLLFFVLFVPLILIAWQYRFRTVLLFAAGTTLLDAILLSPLLQESATQDSIVGGLLFARGAVYALVGYVIGKLIGAQRAHQQDLAHHAATREQLATSNERTRLARELHDTLAHTLSAVAVQLEGATSVWDEDPTRARTMVQRSLEGTRHGLTEARRAIDALRASPLEDLGLPAAVRRLGHDASEVHSIAVDVSAVADVGAVRPEVEHAVYRIAEEAITNAVRHARAASVTMILTRRRGRVELVVTDDGAGFDPNGFDSTGHHGLNGMRERAELVGAELTVSSTAGAGTTIVFAAAP